MQLPNILFLETLKTPVNIKSPHRGKHYDCRSPISTKGVKARWANSHNKLALTVNSMSLLEKHKKAKKEKSASPI